MITPRQARYAVAAIRASFGFIALAAPRALFTSLGLRAEDNADGSYLMRIFGTRELFLAAAEAGAFGKTSVPTALRAGAAVDAVDTVSYVIAHREGRVGKAWTALFGVVGVVAVGLGLYAATDDA